MTNIQLLLIIGVIYLSHDMRPAFRTSVGMCCIILATLVGLGIL